MVSNIPKFYSRTGAVVGKVAQESSKNLEKSELPFLFSAIPWTRKNNPVKALSETQAMIHQKGGLTTVYPSYNFGGSLYSVNRFVHSTKGYTNGLDDCIAVLLYNGDDAFLYHLAPNVHKDKIAIEYMQKGLSDTIQKLQSQNKKCSAVLVGGNNSDGSKSLYENISVVLNQNNIKSQEVLFADGHKSIYYDLKKGIIIDDGVFKNVDELKKDYKNVLVNSVEDIG